MSQMFPRFVWGGGFLGSLIAVLGVPLQGNAYIDSEGYVTPPRFLQQFESVAVVTVDKLNANNSAVIYKVTEQLWGRNGRLPKGSVLKHHSLPKELFAKLKPGQVGVLLHDIEVSRITGKFLKAGDPLHLMFIEGSWYQASRDLRDIQWWECWTRRNYDSMFLGSTEELASVFRKLAHGEDVVVRRKTAAEEQKKGAKETALVRYSMEAPHRKIRVEDSVREPTTDTKIPATETKPLEHLELHIGDKGGEDPEGSLRQALHPIAKVRYLICKGSGITRIYFQDGAPDVDELIRAATKAGFKASRPRAPSKP